MRLSLENLRFAVLIVWIWILSFLRVTFSNSAIFILRVSNENMDQQSIIPEDWSNVKKIVKGVHRLSPLFIKNRKCLMEALIVYSTLKKIKINSKIHIGALKQDNYLRTHAWVSIGNTIIVGGPVSEYEELVKTQIYRK